MSREPQQTALLNGRIDARQGRRARARSMPEIAARGRILRSAAPATWSTRCATPLKALNGSAPIRFERFAAAAAPRPLAAGCRTGTDPRAEPRGPAQEVLATDLGRHGRPAPQLSDGARRCLGARCRRTRGSRSAVLLPFRNLRHLPRQHHAGRRGHDAQHRAWSPGRPRRASCCAARRGRPPPRSKSATIRNSRSRSSGTACHTRPFCSRSTAASPV